jgi:hypothetical protein
MWHWSHQLQLVEIPPATLSFILTVTFTLQAPKLDVQELRPVGKRLKGILHAVAWCR